MFSDKPTNQEKALIEGFKIFFYNMPEIIMTDKHILQYIKSHIVNATPHKMAMEKVYQMGFEDGNKTIVVPIK